MTITTPLTRPDPLRPVTFLECEITYSCGLACIHCYNHSGPKGGHAALTTTDWINVIDQAPAIGITKVQMIGGEPTMHPDLIDLVDFSLDLGLRVDIRTNMVHVSPAMWALYGRDGVEVGVSWYDPRPQVHARIVGNRAAYAHTLANITTAVQRGITVKAGIVAIVEGQDTPGAEHQLRMLGLTNINTDHARPVGRAAPTDYQARPEDLCGNCGRGRAAVLGDGDVSLCVLGRALVAGNVKKTPLAQILTSHRWAELVASVPERDACVSCTPGDSNDCDPSR